jgi:hypothetical protein
VRTTRPEEPILRRVRARNVFELAAGRAENRDDVRAFIEQRLRGPALRAVVGGAAERVARTLETLAESNFLYARLALDALEEGTLPVGDRCCVSSARGSRRATPCSTSRCRTG